MPEYRTCKKCEKRLPIENFPFSHKEQNYRRHSCKNCYSAYKKNYHEQKSLDKTYIQKRRRDAEISNRKRGHKPWAKHLEKIRLNPVPKSYSVAKRRSMLKNANVPWADISYIKDLYRNAKEANKIFNDIGLSPYFQVDHIIPLQNDTVCGLHNQFNLQILNRSDNVSKGNSYSHDDVENFNIGL